MPVARCRIEPSMVTCHFQTCTCGDIGRLSVHEDMRVTFSPRDAVSLRCAPVLDRESALSTRPTWRRRKAAPSRRDEGDDTGNGAGARAAVGRLPALSRDVL